MFFYLFFLYSTNPPTYLNAGKCQSAAAGIMGADDDGSQKMWLINVRSHIVLSSKRRMKVPPRVCWA